jgi:hypothetical protein
MAHAVSCVTVDHPIGYLRALRDWDYRSAGFGHETHGVEVRAGEHYLHCLKQQEQAMLRAGGSAPWLCSADR